MPVQECRRDERMILSLNKAKDMAQILLPIRTDPYLFAPPGGKKMSLSQTLDGKWRIGQTIRLLTGIKGIKGTPDIPIGTETRIRNIFPSRMLPEEDGYPYLLITESEIPIFDPEFIEAIE